MSNVATIHERAPLSIEGEQAVLGDALLNPQHIGRIASRGGADLFHEPTHAEVYRIMAERDRAGELVSPVTISDALRGSEALASLGGAGYLARLATAAPASASISGYLDMLADLKSKRNLVASMSEAQAAIARGEDPAHEIAARLEAALIASNRVDDRRGPVSMQAAVVKAMGQVNSAYVGEETGAIFTGIPELDDLIPGFYPGELIILGGRPSMGKTAVALSMALNIARAGHGVGIVSLEMNPEQMALRALSEATAQSGRATSYKQMRRGDMTETQVDALRGCAESVANLPIYFLERKHADLGAMVAGARQIKRALGDKLKLLIVDYAQLLKAPGRSRYDQITEVSIALKSLAGLLDIPVIALSQLSRGVEQRDDKRPMLSDLRESGQLEQDADAVLFCYRDEYYVERSKPDDEDKLELWQRAMEKAHNRLEIIVAKQRQGDIGTARVRCNVALNLIWSDRK
ncbi:replicative DNA helicase [Thioclava sp. NG1]|uniref:replicative DNA helicase n=1 Tax=Thioclava sp. NG1 TaxID=2182426 RepID=UPI000D619C02|nr:replicative DNA helicase [Thioclava sp. NG1]PWE48465.1 replicative DNA helicase [Thioclava sp. NG1]